MALQSNIFGSRKNSIIQNGEHLEIQHPKTINNKLHFMKYGKMQDPHISLTQKHQRKRQIQTH